MRVDLNINCSFFDAKVLRIITSGVKCDTDNDAVSKKMNNFGSQPQPLISIDANIGSEVYFATR